MLYNNESNVAGKESDFVKTTENASVWDYAGSVIDYPTDRFYPNPRKFFEKIYDAFVVIKAVWLHCFAMEEAYGMRFLIASVMAGSGAVVYFSFDFEPSWIKLLAFLGLCLGLVYLTRRHHYLSLCAVFLLCVSLGVLAGKFEAWRAGTIMLRTDVSTRLTGRILSIEQQQDGRYQLTVDVLGSERPHIDCAPQTIRISARNMPKGVRIGDGIQGFARLRPASGPVRSGNYDFAFHNYFRGIGAQGFFMGMPQIVEIAPPQSLQKKFVLELATLRLAMTKRITDAIQGEPGAVAAALITGHRGGISEQTNEALRISGLAHILSISGLHMAMVSGMVLVVIRSCFALFPIFSSRWPAKKLAALIALAVSAFYLLLSGTDVAAQRSFVMVAVMLVAVLCDRAALTMRNIVIAAVITIVLCPHEILGPSFQMSFAATTALVATFGWWTRRCTCQPNKLKSHKFVGAGLLKAIIVPFVSTGVASVVAGFSSGIFAAYHFSNAAPLGVISNALAFPVMSIAVMPFALLAAIAMPFHLEWLALQIMGNGVLVVQKIAFGITAISPHIHPGYISSLAVVVLSLGLIFLMCLRTRLCLCGVVLLFIGGIIYLQQPQPLLMISEDGKLVGRLQQNHKLAVNLSRPPQFIVKNWLAAFHLDETVRPVLLKSSLLALPLEKRQSDVFICDDEHCTTVLSDGQIFTIVMMEEAKGYACRNADIIFLNYNSPYAQCADKSKMVIGLKDLALYGTVEVFSGGNMKWASGQPERSWNRHRKFSRLAHNF